MKSIVLKSLKLRNFKGIKNLEINFNEGVTNIYGQNKAGKTSTLDAYSWLLFDKDSTGSSNFSIKTLDENNQPIHKLEHEVEATILNNGVETFLRKVYTEKWTKPRGQENEVFSGHTTTYYWNDSPLSKSDYQSRVNEIIPEETFKVLTNPTYFNTIHWEERRKILLNLAGEVSDETVLDITSTDSKMSVVSEILRSGQNLQEVKKAKAAKRKRLNDELKLIPSRIDEVERSKIEDVDYSNVENEIKSINDSISEIDSQIDDNSKLNEAANKKLIEAQNEKAQLERELSSLNNQVEDLKSSEVRKANSKVNELKDSASEIERKIKSIDSRIQSSNLEIKQLENENAKLKEDYKGLTKEPQISENDKVCSCCGQNLPDLEQKIDQIKKDHLQRYNDSVASINKKGVANKSKIGEIENEIEALIKSGDDLQKQLEEVNKSIKEAEESKGKVSGVEIPKELTENIDAIKSKIEGFKMPEVDKVDSSTLKAKRSELNERLLELRTKLSKKDVNINADNRIQELTDQRKKLAQEIADLENVEMQIEKFIKAKMDIVESRVNDLFATCSFKMFEEQVNGGQKATCECLVNGVPFHDVNTAGKINAGVDIINALQSYFEVKAPIWIDNRESVLDLFENDSQVVNLIVSREHKDLYIS